MPRLLALLAMLVLALALAACGRGEDEGEAARGVTEDTITIGGTFPMTGPLAIYNALSKGFEAKVGALNAQGGVSGRKIVYKALDDAYDPSRLASNARRLVEQDKVFGIASFGGPAITLRPYLEQTKTPHWNMSGLSALSDQEKFPHTRAWWPDSAFEAAIQTRYALENVDDPRIGTLMIGNDLGVDLTAGIKKGLGENTAALVKETKYAPTEFDVSSQINQLRDAGVNVLITATTGATTIQMLRYIAQIKWKPMVFMYSGTTSRKAVLEKAGLQNVKGTYSALWLKDPAESKWAGDLQTYFDDVKKYTPNADPEDLFVANGYAAAEAFFKALGTMEDPTQEGMLKALDEFEPTDSPLLQPGVKLQESPGGRLLRQYLVVRFDGEGWEPVGEPVDAVEAGLDR